MAYSKFFSLRQFVFLFVGLGALIAAVVLLSQSGFLFNTASKAGSLSTGVWEFTDTAQGWTSSGFLVPAQAAEGRLTGVVNARSAETAYLASPRFAVDLVGTAFRVEMAVLPQMREVLLPDLDGADELYGGADGGEWEDQMPPLLRNKVAKVKLQYLTNKDNSWDDQKSVTVDLGYGRTLSQLLFDLGSSAYYQEKYPNEQGSGVVGSPKQNKKGEKLTYLRLTPLASGSGMTVLARSFVVSVDAVRLVKGRVRPYPSGDKGVLCPLSYSPVCCEGKTYSNQCTADAAGAGTACIPGACDSEGAGWTGACTQDSDCSTGYRCLGRFCRQVDKMPGKGSNPSY